MMDDNTVLGILSHFYYGDADEEDIKNVNCNIVVSKPELSDEDKAEALMKADEIELLRHLTYHPAEVDKYWASIKIAMLMDIDLGMWVRGLIMSECWTQWAETSTPRCS